VPRDLPPDILREIEHRPWPLPTGGWVMRQTWNDFLFCHWPVPVAAIREKVPPQLELDLWDGEAWLGIIPFHMSGVTLRGFPDLPGFSAFPELNVRTYVRAGGKHGVYFLSLDAHNALAVAIARRWYLLPYYRASMQWGREGDRIRYRSRRIQQDAPPGEWKGAYGPTGPVELARKGTFEHWLTERYALFVVDALGNVRVGEVHHKPWPVQPAEVEIESNTMAGAHGLVLPDTKPHVRFATKVDVVVWQNVGVPIGG
jgi:uncharacterized protein YqjF (DUF2071 family)